MQGTGQEDGGDPSWVAGGIKPGCPMSEAAGISVRSRSPREVPLLAPGTVSSTEGKGRRGRNPGVHPGPCCPVCGSSCCLASRSTSPSLHTRHTAQPLPCSLCPAQAVSVHPSHGGTAGHNGEPKGICLAAARPCQASVPSTALSKMRLVCTHAEPWKLSQSPVPGTPWCSPLPRPGTEHCRGRGPGAGVWDETDILFAGPSAPYQLPALIGILQGCGGAESGIHQPWHLPACSGSAWVRGAPLGQGSRPSRCPGSLPLCGASQAPMPASCVGLTGVVWSRRLPWAACSEKRGVSQPKSRAPRAGSLLRSPALSPCPPWVSCLALPAAARVRATARPPANAAPML